MAPPIAMLCLALAGLTAPSPAPQPILGGAVVASCGWPTVVSVGGFCSGTLIHPQVVAYAAHCGAEVPWIRFTDEIEAEPRREVVPERCAVHPVGAFGFGTDFAFCLLPAPITDIAITPPLMGCEVEQMLTIGRTVTLVGFGQNDDPDPDLNYGIKRFVETQIGGFSWDEVFIGDENKGACYGDSGGPAMVQLADGSWRSFAVTSWGQPGCGAGNYFSLLHRGVDWIETESGIDVTPCHDSLGGWDPSPACGRFAVGDPGIASGTWESCAWDPPSGPGASCGAAFDDAADTTPPSVKILEPGDGSRHNSKTGKVMLAITVEALDVGSGTERVTFRVVDGDKTLFENIDNGAPFVFPALQFTPGLWTLEAEAVDRAGNSMVSERITFGVNVDVPAPPNEASTGDSTGEAATGDTPTMGESGESGDSGGESSSGGTAAALDDEGCGCRSESGSRGVPVLAAGVLMLGLRRRRRASVALALACGLTGCTNDDTQGTTSSTGEDGSTSGTSGTSSTGEAPTTTGAASTSTGEPQPICGNGEIDGEELCDDGNMIAGDGCSPDCQPSGSEVSRRLYPDGGVGSDSINALAIDLEGNLVAAGSLGSGMDQSRAWVAKLSPEGELLWEHVWNSDAGNYNYYLDVAVNAHGQIVAGGCANCGEFADVLLTLIDKDGNFEDREIVAEMEIERISDVTITDTGKVVALVQTTDDLVAHVQAFDAAGAPTWNLEGGDKTWHGGGLVRGAGDAATIVALREAIDPQTEGVRVFAIDDATGDVQWTRLHGDPLTRYYVERLAAGPEGQMVVCGSLIRTDAEDTLLFGLSAKGDELWKTRIPMPGPGWDGCAGVVVTQEGGVAFAGSGYMAGAGVEMWVGKLDAGGTQVWASTYGSMGLKDDLASDLVEMASGELVVGGSLYDETSKSRNRALLRLTP